MDVGTFLLGLLCGVPLGISLVSVWLGWIDRRFRKQEGKSQEKDDEEEVE